MKKLYLTSLGLGRLSDLLTKSPQASQLAFVPTAADPYEDKWFVEADRRKLASLGFKLQELDLKAERAESLRQKLEKVDVIYVAGGNSFYLLEKVIESGFDKVVRDLVGNGLVYAGGSAGAVLAGPDIEPVASLDDPREAPNLRSTKGLGLVDFVILPHYGKEKYREKFDKILSEFSDKDYELVTLTDHEAVVIDGERLEIVRTD